MQSETEPHSPTALKILGIAGQLFMQRGYHAVSINDIVRAAGITKPTLYYHFPDKEELFVQTTIHMLAEVHRAFEVAAAEAPDLAGQLMGMARVLLDPSSGDMRMLRHEMHEHMPAAQQQRLGVAFWEHMIAPVRQVMQGGLERGELAPRPDLALAMLFLGMIESFYQFSPQMSRAILPAEPGEAPNAAFTAEALVDLFLHGVSRRAHS
ncbi:MAG TPA: TetR/AcrR family transcriptional regulator [Roseiflexaceae bacterium]|nr:TetR/AcrR family transcriptional regulator [Roseiflexaceae bacterium]